MEKSIQLELEALGRPFTPGKRNSQSMHGGALEFDRDGLTHRAITKKCYELSEFYSVGFTIGKYGSCVEYHALSLPCLVPLSSACYETLDTRRKPLQPFCLVRDRFRLIRLSQNAG